MAAAMGEPVGIERDQCSAGDCEKAEASPGSKQRRQMRPLGNLATGLGSRQCINNSTKQYRLGKLRGSERNVGDRQTPGQWSLGAEQSENAPIESKNIHARRKLSQSTVVRVVPNAPSQCIQSGDQLEYVTHYY